MKTLQSPSNAFALPATRASLRAGPVHFREITPAEMKAWTEARRAKLLERQRYWQNSLAKQS